MWTSYQGWKIQDKFIQDHSEGLLPYFSKISSSLQWKKDHAWLGVDPPVSSVYPNLMVKPKENSISLKSLEKRAFASGLLRAPGLLQFILRGG